MRIYPPFPRLYRTFPRTFYKNIYDFLRFFKKLRRFCPRKIRTYNPFSSPYSPIKTASRSDTSI